MNIITLVYRINILLTNKEVFKAMRNNYKQEVTPHDEVTLSLWNANQDSRVLGTAQQLAE
jgi:hypothetical protein